MLHIVQLKHSPLGQPPHQLPVIDIRSNQPITTEHINHYRTQFSDNYVSHIINPFDSCEAFFILKRPQNEVPPPPEALHLPVPPPPPQSHERTPSPNPLRDSQSPSARYPISQNLKLSISPRVTEQHIFDALGVYQQNVVKIERKPHSGIVFIDCKDASSAQSILDAFPTLTVGSESGHLSQATTSHPGQYPSSFPIPPPPPTSRPPPLLFRPPPSPLDFGSFSGSGSLFAQQAAASRDTVARSPPQRHSPVFNSADAGGYSPPPPSHPSPPAPFTQPHYPTDGNTGYEYH